MLFQFSYVFLFSMFSNLRSLHMLVMRPPSRNFQKNLGSHKKKKEN